jgi:hypothetical protein
MDIWRGMTDSMGSSRSHQQNRKSRTPFVFSDPEWSQHASRLLSTTRGERCRKEYEKNLVARRKNGAHSAVGCVQYRSQHRGGNRPENSLMTIEKLKGSLSTYSHCRMESSSDFIVLLQSWTAPKNLWQPKLPNSSLHMADFPLRRCWCLHPL